MRRLGAVLLVICVVLLTESCEFKKMTGEKLRDLPYTVLGEDELPEELKAIVEKKKGEPMEEIYTEKGWMYLVRGYGEKDTSGYSISVKECYETDGGICLETELVGPAGDDEAVPGKTYPYLVVKLEQIDKAVKFALLN